MENMAKNCPVHDNIIQSLNFAQGQIQMIGQAQQQCFFVVLEFVEGGRLFDLFIDNGSMFTEEICRYYIKNIITAVNCIHKNGLAHRKLSPYEILLNNDRNVVKVGDFSFSNHIRG